MLSTTQGKVNPLLLGAAAINTRIHAAVQYVCGLAQDGKDEGEGEE